MGDFRAVAREFDFPYKHPITKEVEVLMKHVEGIFESSEKLQDMLIDALTHGEGDKAWVLVSHPREDVRFMSWRYHYHVHRKTVVEAVVSQGWTVNMNHPQDYGTQFEINVPEGQDAAAILKANLMEAKEALTGFGPNDPYYPDLPHAGYLEVVRSNYVLIDNVTAKEISAATT